MISKNTKSIPILVRPPLIALNCQKMAESNRKCLRLREWFVQEEIARAIDTALETIIGLSKRKQFKYHRGEGLFALDFHTARLTSVWKPPFLYTWRLKGLKIASLSSETLVLRILLFIKPAKLSNHFFNNLKIRIFFKNIRFLCKLFYLLWLWDEEKGRSPLDSMVVLEPSSTPASRGMPKHRTQPSLFPQFFL